MYKRIKQVLSGVFLCSAIMLVFNVVCQFENSWRLRNADLVLEELELDGLYKHNKFALDRMGTFSLLFILPTVVAKDVTNANLLLNMENEISEEIKAGSLHTELSEKYSFLSDINNMLGITVVGQFTELSKGILNKGFTNNDDIEQLAEIRSSFTGVEYYKALSEYAGYEIDLDSIEQDVIKNIHFMIVSYTLTLYFITYLVILGLHKIEVRRKRRTTS